MEESSSNVLYLRFSIFWVTSPLLLMSILMMCPLLSIQIGNNFFHAISTDLRSICKPSKNILLGQCPSWLSTLASAEDSALARWPGLLPVSPSSGVAIHSQQLARSRGGGNLFDYKHSSLCPCPWGNIDIGPDPVPGCCSPVAQLSQVTGQHIMHQ